ncbi:MAG: NCS2 family permease, partial [Ancrocorticia sp.]|nr:NCS2 family permease [Ancrocorticia sp.]
LVVTGLREAIFRAVPMYLRTAISVGIGMFITLVGLVNAGMVRTGGGTPLTFGVEGSVSTLPMAIFVIGLFVTAILMVRKVKGAILIGIISSTVLAVIVEAVGKLGVSGEDNPGGWNLSVPSISGSPIQLPSFATLGEFSITGPFQKLGVIAVVVLTFSVLLADFFDTMGTMVAVATEGDLLDEDGNPEGTSRILLVDSVGAIAGGMGGVSSNTAFVESSTGVADGGRPGLTSIVTGVAFFLATFLSPIVALVPNEAAAPALVAVGFLMMQQVPDINWNKLTTGIPAFLTIVMMPFGYSMTVGIGVGFIAHVVLQAATGNAKKVHPLLWLVAILFVVYFLMGPIQSALA